MAGLEARLIISATDDTAKAFRSAEERVKALSRTVAGASKSIAGTTGRIGAAASSSRAVESAGMGMGVVTGAARMAAGAAIAFGGAVAVKEAVKAVAARQHEIVRMATAGMNQKEISEAVLESSKPTAEFPAVSQTDAMHMLRNARSIVGTFAEASAIAEPMLKLRVLAQLARPGQDVTEDFDQLIKGLEIKGVTQNPEQFKEYMQGIANGINVFGDTLKPYQYYEMFKYGRQATSGLSEKFILGTAPTLAQELGGSSYGRAVSAFNAAIVGGVMKTKAVDEFYRLGLLGDEDVKTLKSGNKQILAGHNVHGWEVAQKDPNEWVKTYLLPALDRLGINSKETVLREVSTLFQNQMAGQMVGLLATQQSRIDKDLALLAGAPGLAAADRAMRQDPTLAWEGLKNAATSLSATVGQSLHLGELSAGVMTTLAQAIAGYAAALEGEVQAQNQGKPSPATEETNRHLNKLVFGVDTPDTEQAVKMSDRLNADAEYKATQKLLIDKAGALQQRIDIAEGNSPDGARALIKQARPELTDAQADALIPNAVAQLKAELPKLNADMAALSDAARRIRDEYEASLPARGKEDYARAKGAAGWPMEGSQVYGPFQPGPPQGEAAYVAAAVRAAHEAVYGPQAPERALPAPVSGPGSRSIEDPSQAAYRAMRASASSQKTTVGVQGSAQVEQTIRLDISVPSWLEAKLEELSNFNFSVPMAPTGRMDSDAAPHGGIGHM
jgi:hypothetical protein